MRSWVRGGSGLPKAETKRKELLKVEDYTQTIKNHCRSLQTELLRERKREEGNRETESVRKHGFKMSNNNWKIQ